MATWPDNHPSWDYRIYDNAYLQSRQFKNSELIAEYLRRGRLAGVADLMRYEILHEVGGFMPGADSICLQPCDDLFVRPTAYTVFENEFARGSLVSPILACEPGNMFVATLIDELSLLSPSDLGDPWVSTGNLFVARMIARHDPDIVIWPSHFMIPKHKDGLVYEGDGPVYAEQMWGTTKGIYGSKFGLSSKLGRRVRRRWIRAQLKRFGRRESQVIKSRRVS